MLKEKLSPKKETGKGKQKNYCGSKVLSFYDSVVDTYTSSQNRLVVV